MLQHSCSCEQTAVSAGMHEVMTKCHLSCLMMCLQKIKHLEWWRLCFFLATLAPICWATSLAVKLLVMAVESQLFIAKNVLYFMAAIKVDALVLRSHASLCCFAL